MKKNSGLIGNSGAHTSPGTPEYGDNYGGVGIPKGWMSERVPLPHSSRRHISAAALMPFNSGRALPSKWDDAERWITSPVSGYGVCKTSSLQPHRRPKSKSGPLTPGLMYLPNYSHTVPVLEGRSGRNFMAGSPFNTGVLVPDGLSIHYGVGNGVKPASPFVENTLAQSTSTPGLTDVMLIESSISGSQDDKLDGNKDAESAVSRDVSRRDMATQMSPEGSTHSSVNGMSSFSAFPPSMPTEAGPQSYSSSIVEVRDVQVDNDATITRSSRKHVARKIKKGSSDVKDSASLWDVSSTAKNRSKSQREAKITAWENLQKAKAEAAIRKLEMKLEKKRSASMDKIMNKLRADQMKAQEMRNSITEDQGRRSPTTSSRKVLLCKHVKIISLSNCFFCCK